MAAMLPSSRGFSAGTAATTVAMRCDSSISRARSWLRTQSIRPVRRSPSGGRSRWTKAMAGRGAACAGTGPHSAQASSTTVATKMRRKKAIACRAKNNVGAASLEAVPRGFAARVMGSAEKGARSTLLLGAASRAMGNPCMGYSLRKNNVLAQSHAAMGRNELFSCVWSRGKRLPEGRGTRPAWGFPKRRTRSPASVEQRLLGFLLKILL